MSKPLFDQEALISMFESASAKQATQLKAAVSQATLQALQGREMTLKNVRSALKQVSEAASLGAAKNAGLDPAVLLDKAVSGMDDALLKAVDAHRAALSQLSAQGASLSDKALKKALDDLDKFEDMAFGAMKKAADSASAPIAGAWAQVLEKFQAAGLPSGAKAALTAEQIVEQMQAASKTTRAAGLRAAQVLADSYAAMVSGVLIGMSDAMRGGAAAEPPAKKK